MNKTEMRELFDNKIVFDHEPVAKVQYVQLGENGASASIVIEDVENREATITTQSGETLTKKLNREFAIVSPEVIDQYLKDVTEDEASLIMAWSKNDDANMRIVTSMPTQKPLNGSEPEGE